MFNTEKISWQEVENAQVLVKQDIKSMKVLFFSQKIEDETIDFQIQN